MLEKLHQRHFSLARSHQLQVGQLHKVLILERSFQFANQLVERVGGQEGAIDEHPLLPVSDPVRSCAICFVCISEERHGEENFLLVGVQLIIIRGDVGGQGVVEVIALGLVTVKERRGGGKDNLRRHV